MEPWIFLIVGIALLLFLIPTIAGALTLYIILLVRTSKKKWTRTCSEPDDPEQVKMYEQGLAWKKENELSLRNVDIYNDKLHLFGQYFDFGYEKTVLIIPGRMEACEYSYYYAKPYQEAKCNVLVIDNRAHGLSDGKISTLGIKEYRDILAWGKFLHEQLHNKKVILHGICIGSSTAIRTMVDKHCEDYIVGMVAEGMYATFYDSFKNHLIERKKPIFPFALAVSFIIHVMSGKSIRTDGPIKQAANMQKPILWLHSRVDQYSSPQKAQEMYDICPSKVKQIIWFDVGKHSRVRLNNQEQYDAAIVKFINENLA